MTASTKATLVAVLLMTMLGAVIARDIPEFLHVCKTNDPQYSDCILESIESLRPYLETGVPEYNIPSLEPLELKELKFSSLNTLRIKATDIDVTGSSNFIVRNVE